MIVTTTVTFAALLALVVTAAVRSRTMASPLGVFGSKTGLPAGAQGVVRRPLEPIGSIHAAGEEWTARSVDDQPIERGTIVKVVSVEGLTVLVEPDPLASSI